jgi:hypothetical protein
MTNLATQYGMSQVRKMLKTGCGRRHWLALVLHLIGDRLQPLHRCERRCRDHVTQTTTRCTHSGSLCRGGLPDISLQRMTKEVCKLGHADLFKLDLIEETLNIDNTIHDSLQQLHLLWSCELFQCFFNKVWLE